MSDRVPEPTELIYLPGESWAPVLIAAGIAILIAAAFTQWWWAVVGLIVVLAGLRSWWRTSDDEISRMRVEQEIGTAVIPAEPIRRKA
jgi:hypothetical protein